MLFRSIPVFHPLAGEVNIELRFRAAGGAGKQRGAGSAAPGAQQKFEEQLRELFPRGQVPGSEAKFPGQCPAPQGAQDRLAFGHHVAARHRAPNTGEKTPIIHTCFMLPWARAVQATIG